MGSAFEIVTGYNSPSTTTAGTYTAFTANSGQSFSIRQANGSPAGQVFGPWGQFGAAGKLQIKTPRWHDTTVGDTYHINIDTATYMPYSMLGLDDWEPAYATDNLTVQSTTDVSQTGATQFAVGIPIYYSDLPGVDGNFMSWQQVIGYRNYTQKTGLHYVTWVVPSSAGTAGQIGTGVLINATNDQYKANHSYALLGYTLSAGCGTLLVQGTDTGNLYVGGPGTVDERFTKRWFVELSQTSGLPLIPIIQANNKSTTNVYIVDAATTSTAFTVGLHWMDLGVIGQPPGV